MLVTDPTETPPEGPEPPPDGIIIIDDVVVAIDVEPEVVIPRVGDAGDELAGERKEGEPVDDVGAEIAEAACSVNVRGEDVPLGTATITGFSGSATIVSSENNLSKISTSAARFPFVASRTLSETYPFPAMMSVYPEIGSGSFATKLPSLFSVSIAKWI
jgi:hypothetical protein